MSESFETSLQRFYFNIFPCYAASGAKVLYIASDWHQIKIKISLSWLTKNYIGTIFGGSMFAATDPMFMIMLIKILGEDYVVLDKGATIDFIKPGKGTLYATFNVSTEDVDAIKDILLTERKTERSMEVDLVDDAGVVHARVKRLIYIRKAGT